MKQVVVILFLFIVSDELIFSQGINSHWPIGYYSLGNDPNQKARLIFNSSSFSYQHEYRNMNFRGTQATLSDMNGSFLMSSNGVWIANALNDTMMNGSGLNPSWDVAVHPNGLLIFNGNVFLPFPGDSNKYLLIHEAKLGQFSIDPTRVYYSVIDITLDGGLGAVIQKNDTILEDTLSWGLAACKHANGRDWWVVAVHDGNPLIYKMLFTSDGLSNISTQQLNYTFNTWGNASQILFSQQGDKFLYNSGVNQTQSGYVLITDFDRCTGDFSNEQVIPVSTGAYLWGLAFSPSGEYVYACTSTEIFQIDILSLTFDTVAVFDGFASPFPPFYTTFMLMYLAANGKIYITSGNSTSHFHFINYPDSAGMSCNVQQHALSIDSVRHFRAVPNHPNYYLGPLAGSVCDTLGLSIAEQGKHDFRFSISPNPSDGNFRIMYLLPQNQKGFFNVNDVNGRKVYSQNLPQWSTVQYVSIPFLSDGIYQCVITSEGKRASKKMAVIKE